METYCYEYQPLWFSYPIEPKEVGCGIVLDQALGMRNTSKGEEQSLVKWRLSRCVQRK